MKKQKDHDFVDELEILTHSGSPIFLPQPPSETIDVASILSQSYFGDHGWPLIRVLNWIAFRDVARIGDSSWNRLKFRTNENSPALVEQNPRRRLLEALQAGRITAAMPGREFSPRDWDSIQPHELERDFGATTYLRDEVLREWSIADAESEQVESSPVRKGRPPSVDWQIVDDEICRLMDENGDFVDGDRSWNSQAKLQKEMASFIDKKFGENAVKADSTIRKHTSKALEKWRKATTEK